MLISVGFPGGELLILTSHWPPLRGRAWVRASGKHIVFVGPRRRGRSVSSMSCHGPRHLRPQDPGDITLGAEQLSAQHIQPRSHLEALYREGRQASYEVVRRLHELPPAAGALHLDVGEAVRAVAHGALGELGSPYAHRCPVARRPRTLTCRSGGATFRLLRHCASGVFLACVVFFLILVLAVLILVPVLVLVVLVVLVVLGVFGVLLVLVVLRLRISDLLATFRHGSTREVQRSWYCFWMPAALQRTGYF